MYNKENIMFKVIDVLKKSGVIALSALMLQSCSQRRYSESDFDNLMDSGTNSVAIEDFGKDKSDINSEDRIMSGTQDSSEINKENLSDNPYISRDGAHQTQKIIDVPLIYQSDKLPTACESISATMVLQYFNVDISVYDFIDNYLPMQDMTKVDGQRYGPDPNEVFAGSPYDRDSFGCFSHVIYKAMKSAAGDDLDIYEHKDQSIEYLIDKYIVNDIPVLLWVTTGMQPSVKGAQWIIYDTGETYQWRSKEHCMVLVGYDEEHYYFNDPQVKDSTVAFDKSLVATRYKEMGMQAVAAVPISVNVNSGNDYID